MAQREAQSSSLATGPLADGTVGRAVVLAMAGAAGLFLAWQASGALLLVFAGLLFAALLDACTRALSLVVPIGRRSNLAIVCVAIALAIGGLMFWSGYSVVQQTGELGRLLADQLGELQEEISGWMDWADDRRNVAQMLLPNPQHLFGGATTAFFAALGFIGSTVIIVLIGLFVAADPTLYRDGFLSLLPATRRKRFGKILDDAADMMEWWIIGQIIEMAAIALLTWIMLLAFGVPNALLLAIIAGLLNFIPYLGPFLTAVPILLATLSLGASAAIWVLVLFTVIQSVMGYAVMPLIQKRAVDMPPALTLASLTVFGTLFGGIGIVLATPLVALVLFIVRRLRGADADG